MVENDILKRVANPHLQSVSDF